MVISYQIDGQTTSIRYIDPIDQRAKHLNRTTRHIHVFPGQQVRIKLPTKRARKIVTGTQLGDILKTVVAWCAIIRDETSGEVVIGFQRKSTRNTWTVNFRSP